MSITVKNGVSASRFKTIIRFGGKFIDYKIGILGSVLMGAVVFCVNYYLTRESLGSMTAAIKQGCYTLLCGGSIMKGCEYFATRIKKNSLAILTAIIVPSIVAVALTMILHYMRGTPEPEYSTVPTALGIIPTTAIWGIRKRKKFFREEPDP